MRDAVTGVNDHASQGPLAHLTGVVIDSGDSVTQVIQLAEGYVKGLCIKHKLNNFSTCLYEGSDASSGDGDVLDARPDDVPLGHRDDVRDAVAGVDDHASQGPLAHLTTRPGRSQRQHSLHRDVQPWGIDREN